MHVKPPDDESLATLIPSVWWTVNKKVRIVCLFIQQDFLKKILLVTCPFVGPLIPLFWTSGGVSSGFQSQSGFCLIRILPRRAWYPARYWQNWKRDVIVKILANQKSKYVRNHARSIWDEYYSRSISPFLKRNTYFQITHRMCHKKFNLIII